ncbi:MAG: MBL fold metallo-hydrolase [Candidatus Heimdallarchaeum endolithica]|uniref:MBL fold metallo-hydrolase n=1 Tax=Candidatus Heimdallarchaeum endolithica TaxID=2876572 RepID=A0A9Y1BSR2_9ARCH|nr:MAG: MBL fold metallo-hydrolase [Candidatus Heimdallarchaeum endolithica]
MVEFIKITPSVYAHVMGETRGNVAFINLRTSIAFIDSGIYPTVAKEARKVAEETTGLKTKYLIITHYHSDHILGNQVFEDCKIISSKDTYNLIKKDAEERFSEDNIKKYIKENPELRDKWKGLRIVLPNETFEEKYILKEGEKTLEIVQVGGHTKGSSYVYFKEEEVVIVSDLLFSETFPYAGDETSDIQQWIKALQIIKKLQPNIVVPGHGPITSVKEIDTYIHYFEEFAEKIEKYVKEDKPLEDINIEKDLPSFPYHVDETRIKMMVEHVYHTIKGKMDK